jgi:hypothetical protein
MPLVWWFRGETGSKALRRLGDLLVLPGAIVLFVAPTLVLRFITDSGALGGGFALGGWGPVQYLWFLLAGYLIVSHERLQQRIIQGRWICLMLAVLMYEYLVRRFNVLRVLFGMKPLRRVKTSAAVALSAAKL